MAAKVRTAAEAHGRKFYIMYDVTGWTAMQQQIKDDWTNKMKAHTASEIADKMPADYLVPSKELYVAALQNQLSIFGTDCKMPAAGPATVLKVEQNYVSSFRGKNANLSETYTNEFANKAS